MASGEEIVKRDIKFGIADAPSPDWFQGDPLRTAFVDALSLFFPQGERMFIRAVRYYLKEVDDPKLLADIDAFCVQEAYHTREHEGYNRSLAAEGIDVAMMDERIRKVIDRIKRPIMRLAATVAIEHLTFSFAHVVLTYDEMFAGVPEHYRDIWIWHALEEMEHKAVAYDVFLHVTRDWSPLKRYNLRCVVMWLVLVRLHKLLFANAATIMRARGLVPGFKAVCIGLWQLFGSPGYYRRTLWKFLTYFRPSFHPWDNEVEPLAAKWRSYFNARAGHAPASEA